jgi:hypothetical protein
MKLSGGSWPNSAVCYIMLMSLALVGCSQHESIPTSEQTASADQHLPFDATSDKAGIFPTGSLTPTAIPAGTPVAVRLRTFLSSATSRPGDSFEAVLDEPIYVRGRMVAPRGAKVTGRVLDARAASELQEAGYMRLALIAVSLNGQSLPMQTSSIFVKRGSHEKRNLNEVIGTSASDGSMGVTSIGVTSIGIKAIGIKSTGNTSISNTSSSNTSISNASINKASISNASISKVSISKVSTGGLASNGKGSLIGASTGVATGLEADYAIENKDVGIAPERRLTFRLAQPLPL